MIFNSKMIMEVLMTERDKDVHVFTRSIGENRYILQLSKVLNNSNMFLCEMKVNSNWRTCDFIKLTIKKSIDDMQNKLFKEIVENIQMDIDTASERINNWSNFVKKQSNTLKEISTDFVKDAE